MGFADDSTVELDGDARWLHLEEPEEAIHRETGGKAPRLAV
jgi:hypothetical protein